MNGLNITKLSECDSVNCEGLLTLNECKRVVQKLKKNKTPGSDGLR